MRGSRILTALLTLTLALSARADWPAGGKMIMRVDDSFRSARHLGFFDLASGDFIAFAAGLGGLSHGFTLQRFTPAGDIAPGWSPTGLDIGQTSVTLPQPFLQGFALDAHDNLWHTYPSSGTTVSGSQIDPSAALTPPTVPGWTLFSATSTSMTTSDAAPDADGGMYVCFGGTRLKRFTSTGSLAAGWPATGSPMPGSSSGDAALLPDGAGGVVYFGSSGSAGPSAQRIDATGARHVGWPASGLALSVPAAFTDDRSECMGQPLVRSGPEHFFAAWTGPPTSALKSITLQRFGLDGTIDPEWPLEGAEVAPQDSNSGVTLIEDGADGVYVLWYRNGRPAATHVLADGNVLGPQGQSLVPASTGYVRPTYLNGAFTSTLLPYVVADRRSDGGLTFAWDDTTAAGTKLIRVRRLQPDLSPDPGQSSEGVVVVPAPQDPERFNMTLRGLHSDGAGGAYVGWQVFDATVQQPNSSWAEIWMTRVTPAPTTGVPPRPGAATLALSAPRPNPARGSVALDVTLSDGALARVELLDVTGRIVRRQSVRGVGAHALTFGELGSLEPGLYFARISSGHSARSTRLVVAH